jgi:hypothetical protein
VVVWGDKVVLWWWGVEMLMWCVVNVVGVCMTLYESPLISKLVEICRFPVSSRPLSFTLSALTVLFEGGLQTETYLLRPSFYRCPSTFGARSCFLDTDGPITFDLGSEVSV